jgi:hypothetical protein
VKKADFQPVYSYEVAYTDSTSDSISWQEVDSLLAFLSGFQNELQEIWINFRVESTTLSFSHTFPDYGVNFRRIGYILDRMKIYLGKGYRVTTEMETIRKTLDEFDKPEDRIVIEFGEFQR